MDLQTSEQTDILIRGCLQNDRRAQRQLYDQFSPVMLGVCMRYARSREEAEEILQEGFLKVFSKIYQYGFQGSFEGWVRKIMVNSALEKLRSSRSLHPVISTDNLQSGQSDENFALSALGEKELLRIVQQLSPMYRMVFNLYVFEGYKHREIADMLGISEGISKSNLSDARTILKKAVLNSRQVARQKTY